MLFVNLVLLEDYSLKFLKYKYIQCRIYHKNINSFKYTYIIVIYIYICIYIYIKKVLYRFHLQI